MTHRTFIAIPISEELRQEILKIEERYRHLPFRWTAPDNIHLTLVFLGNIPDDGLRRTQEIVEQVRERYSTFTVEFGELIYGPSQKLPRMIWLEGKPSQELTALVRDLEDELAKDPLIRYAPSRPFRHAHLTLARRKGRPMKLGEPRPSGAGRDEKSSLPKLNDFVSFVLPVNVIQLVTSELRPEGPRYTVVKEAMLAKK